MKIFFSTLFLTIFFLSSSAAAADTLSHAKTTGITKNTQLNKKSGQIKDKPGNNKDKKDKKDKKDEDKKDDSPPEIGNFALPSSQQPGPLLSFGQNIIDKNNKQIFLFADYYNTKNGYYSDTAPNFVYAFSDTSSIFLYVPFAYYKQDDCRSSGIEDVYLQYEYAFYLKSNKKFAQTGTLVASVIFPSGSFEKCPSTGNGGISYFIGGTINRMYTDWYLFFSPGINLISSNNGSHEGNKYYYQAGIGKNICSLKGKWIFNWLIEVDGLYNERNRFNTVIDPDSGGNIVLVTPSLWLSTKRWIIQFGVGAPVVQHLFGDQARYRYLLITDIGYSF